MQKEKSKSDHIDSLTEEQLHEMLLFVNAAAACVIQRKGALKVVQGHDDIARMLLQIKA